jgi:hypothetical protein
VGVWGERARRGVGAWAFLETNGKGECFSKRGGLSEAKMTSKVD